MKYKLFVTVVLALATWGVLALGNKLMPPVDHGAPMLGWLVYMFFPILLWMAIAEWWLDVIRGRGEN